MLYLSVNAEMLGMIFMVSAGAFDFAMTFFTPSKLMGFKRTDGKL